MNCAPSAGGLAVVGRRLCVLSAFPCGQVPCPGCHTISACAPQPHGTPAPRQAHARPPPLWLPRARLACLQSVNAAAVAAKVDFDAAAKELDMKSPLEIMDHVSRAFGGRAVHVGK